MTKAYLNRGSELAAALRALAERFDTWPDVEFPDLSVSIGVQVCQHSGDIETRIEAVDILSLTAVGVPGETRRMYNGTYHHSNPLKTRRRDGIDIAIYTAGLPTPQDVRRGPATPARATA